MRKPKYTDGDLQAALKAVRDGSSVNSAAKSCGIPEATLRKKLKVGEETICANKFTGVLSQEEEEHLYDWILTYGDVGLGRTAREIMDESLRIIERHPRERSFPRGKPSRHWYYRFIKRVQESARVRCKAVPINADTVTEAGIRTYHAQVEAYLRKEGLFDHMFQSDRVACASFTTLNVLAANTLEYLNTGVITPPVDPKNQITVMFTTLANGKFFPPFIMFPYERMPSEIKTSLQNLQSVRYCKSVQGSLSAHFFVQYLKTVVVEYLDKYKLERPLLLFIDQAATSYLSVEAWDFCQANDIFLLRMYPNSAWQMDPLTVEVFPAFKTMWDAFLFDTKVNFGTPVWIRNFAELLNEFMETRSYALQECVETGFKKAGLYPWTQDVIDFAGLINHSKQQKQVKVVQMIFMRRGKVLYSSLDRQLILCSICRGR